MIPRTIFSSEHEQFRDSVRRFLEQEAVPFHAQWEKDGHIDRALWNKAGEAGMLCSHLPEEYGGMGGDYRHEVVLMEQMGAKGVDGFGRADAVERTERVAQSTTCIQPPGAVESCLGRRDHGKRILRERLQARGPAGFPDLSSAAAWFGLWLRTAALPVWWTLGADRERGFVPDDDAVERLLGLAHGGDEAIDQRSAGGRRHRLQLACIGMDAQIVVLGLDGVEGRMHGPAGALGSNNHPTAYNRIFAKFWHYSLSPFFII